MNRFGYIRPASLGDAIAAAAQGRSAFLAGGTNLLEKHRRFLRGKGGVCAPR